MIEKNSFALLPLDNRPVSYLLPKQVADFSGIDLILPERRFLGGLKNGSDLKYIENWLKELNDIGTLIISLDNFVYGGLIQSRKHSFKSEELEKRVNLFKNYCRDMPRHVSTVYGFSSIMRISNYNSDEEEKDYWKEYGEKIFQGAFELIPPEILADYKAHRNKNFSINLLWLESLHEDCFKYLVFSCDDSSQHGINVIEAEYIKKQIESHKFSQIAKVISGTDEIPLVLLTKAVLDHYKIKPTVSLYFDSEEGKNQLAKYESNSIYASVLNQVETLGLEIKDSGNSDLIIFVHCSDSIQGDHVFHNEPKDISKNVENFKKTLEEIKNPFVVTDLAYANGSDPKLIQSLTNSKVNWTKCYGYAGWNTASNSIGTALAIGVNRWVAEKRNVFNEKAFKKCLLVRFLDDYAYQAQIRHKNINEIELNDRIKSHVKTFSKLLDLNDINVKGSLPWNRSFEVEIII